MRFKMRNLIIWISLAFILLYIIAFILDAIYPSYLGVRTLSTLLVFKKTVSVIPSAPALNNGWWDYFGTTYYGIALLPALLGSLKFDFTVMLASLGISALVGSAIGFIANYTGGAIRRFIFYMVRVLTAAPYLLVMLLILYIARPDEAGIIAAISVGWFPFYIIRYIESSEFMNGKKHRDNWWKLLKLLPYILTDMGAISGIVVIITYFGFYFKNPFVVDIGNIMYLGGNVSTFLAFGAWWTAIFPLLFITVFIGFTTLLSYEIRGVVSDAEE
jgi:ABC-type dipeptide/oligopeptide/nickel transport system permease subunit